MNTKNLASIVLLVCLGVSACSPATLMKAPTAVIVETAKDVVQPREPIVQATSASIVNHPSAAVEKPLGGAPLSPQVQFTAPPTDNTFVNPGVNPFVDAGEDHLSTFGLDVDTAAYTVMRRYLNDGNLPPADSVRVEEYINYFKMNYPSSPDVAFAIYADGAPSPYTNDGTVLVRIGIQGYQVSEAARKPANLVFVIDISGSMSRENRLELVKQSLQILVERLRPDDTVGIVVFGSEARVILEPVSGNEKDTLLEAIYALNTEGSTNAEAGLTLGYEMAMRAYRPGANNRVILCSDGVANTGATDPNVILDRIHGYVSEGVTLTAVGFGMGNFNDALLEQMADKGNGFYAYIDDLDEARKLFVDQLTSTLQVIARDAKVQVDFNPDVVQYYRLMGYENRAIADQDFRDDTVDAGEIGAGHSVTALYAVRLTPGSKGRIATVQLRWQDPDTYEAREINGNFNTWDLAANYNQADPHFQLAAAVAQFAEALRDSPYTHGSSLYVLRQQASNLSEILASDPDVVEFANLVERALQINPEKFR